MRGKLTYEDLKKNYRKAHSALITLWEDLSRISRASARKDLREDWGFRYSVTWEFTIDGETTLIFKDDHSGDIFTYVSYRNEWI
jgi:hypothetical protein